MEKSNVVIIGGVACGPKTGAVLARRKPDASITLFQKEERTSYAACGMPYFASGDVASFAELDSTTYGITRDADFFARTRGFKIVTGAEVIAINREIKTVTVKMLATGQTFEHGYDQLVLATGATPNKPPFPVQQSDRIRPFTRPDDAIAFRQMAEQGKIGRALVVGGGFIGCEVAEAAGGLWGIEVVLVERESQLLPFVLDPEMAKVAERELVRQNVDLRLSVEIQKIELDDTGAPVATLSDGSTVTADYVFLCLGVTPTTALAKECGLEIGPSGGILVNQQLRTSDASVYAGGDCVESHHQLTGQPIYLPMGSIANRHGRVIAENIAGTKATFPGVLGAFVVKVFDMNVGAVGLSERAAQTAGIETALLWGSFADKPDYYPESKTFVLKMIYVPGSGRLLGLQAVGAGDICRRIDSFSAFLGKNGTIDDLLDFEHGYAPPYSEALDPLYHLACMAQAQRSGLKFHSPTTDFTQDRNLVLLDVRQPDEFETEPIGPVHGHCPEPVNIPMEELRERVGELDPAKRTVLFCKRGPRSYWAAMILVAAGFKKVEILAGGLQSLL